MLRAFSLVVVGKPSETAASQDTPETILHSISEKLPLLEALLSLAEVLHMQFQAWSLKELAKALPEGLSKLTAEK